MRTLTALYLLAGAAADHGTWDHPQQADLPSHEWLVVDHAPGIGLVAYLCVSKKKQSSTSTRESDVENEMVKTGAAMS